MVVQSLHLHLAISSPSKYSASVTPPQEDWVLVWVMSRLTKPSDGYSPLLSSESGDEDNEKGQLSPQGKKLHGRHLFVVTCLAIGCLTIAFAIRHFLSQEIRSSIAPYKPCRHPTIRHEWRSLSREEKSAYLDAVKCLRTVPSRLGLNHTLYDDFPYFHSRTGESGAFS